MISKWSKFNEAKNNKYLLENNKYLLDIELVEDYFQPVKDKGIEINIGYYVTSYSDDVWNKFSDIDLDMPVMKIGYGVEICDKFDFSNIEEMSKMVFDLKEINDICKRISSNYNTNLSIRPSDYEGYLFIFEFTPTKYDACFITYDKFKDYISDLADIDYLNCKISSRFIQKENDYFTEISTNIDITVDEFIKHLKIFCKEVYNKLLYDEIKKVKNKYIIKNLVCPDDIQFKY